MTYPLSIAPMLDRTDRHYRYMMRQITSRTLLYTEMITAAAIIFGNKQRHLDYSVAELPLAIQLAGDNPKQLAEAATFAKDWGYSEINLNVGCPSDRVQNANFGACLMAKPKLVAELVQAIKNAIDLPVTVKHRIGIDDLDSYEDMRAFVDELAAVKVDRLTIHARKAWLSGLSPKANRNIPPLRYEEIYRLKEELPYLIIEINGGIKTLEEAKEHLNYVDAVMIGRAAYDNPFMFMTADKDFFGQASSKTKREVIFAMIDYIDQMRSKDVYLSYITKHMLKMFTAVPGAKAWRRYISENSHTKGAGSEVIVQAMAFIPDEILDA